MSGTPKYKAFRGKEYVAAFKHAEDAAVLISAEVIDRVTYDRAVWVWTETDDPAIAGESYEGAAELMHQRLAIHNIKAAHKLGYSAEQIRTELHHKPENIALAGIQ